MADPSLQTDFNLAELAHLVSEIRERVRERHAATTGGAIDLPLPDLTPLLQARDAAQAKVAAIGSVNPRPGGVFNGIIQAVKRNIARSLSWFVRDQVDFNREMVRALNATLDALDESNRTFARLATTAGERVDALAHQVHQIQQVSDGLTHWQAWRAEWEHKLVQVSDILTHWQAWRAEWEHKLVVNEAQFARSTADLQHAFQHRVTVSEENLRNQIGAQHREYLGALDVATRNIQSKLWDDLARIRAEYESLIHHELRVVRQRGLFTSAPGPSAPPVGYDSPELDWLKFAEKFRGSADYVRRTQLQYVDRFRGATSEVLDIGCGRGEFLQLLGEAGVPARGIEASAELVSLCREQGLQAEQADLFAYLTALPDNSLGGIFCAQVVEHLTASDALRLVKLAAAKLKPRAMFVAETPNPECLAIFATHFYIDPTHTRPLPPALLAFYFEEAGFGRIEVVRLAPAVESMPALNDLPTGVRETFFGSLDYACIGIKL